MDYQISGVGKVKIENSMITCNFNIDHDAFNQQFGDLMKKLSAGDMAGLNSAIKSKNPQKVRNEAIFMDFFAKVADRKNKPK
jgi:hypothetical protein